MNSPGRARCRQYRAPHARWSYPGHAAAHGLLDRTGVEEVAGEVAAEEVAVGVEVVLRIQEVEDEQQGKLFMSILRFVYASCLHDASFLFLLRTHVDSPCCFPVRST